MKLKYFAWLKDEVGCEEEEITLPVEINTVGGLINWLSQRSPRYEQAFEFIDVVKVVVNQAYVEYDHPIKNDDEAIFMPPIAGG